MRNSLALELISIDGSSEGENHTHLREENFSSISLMFFHRGILAHKVSTSADLKKHKTVNQLNKSAICQSKPQSREIE
jgi:hypothetical protein